MQEKETNTQRAVSYGGKYFLSCEVPPFPVTQVVCTNQSTLFINKKDGHVYQTGTLHGQIYNHPTKLTIPLPLKCTQIAAGRHFCLGKLEGGQGVVSWGAGHFGQLGLGGEEMITFTATPILIERLLPRQTGSTVSQVACGSWHALALTDSGKVWAWGSNRNWQCGRPLSNRSQAEAPTFTVPLPVPQLDDVYQIAAGRSHSVALTKTDSQVYCWGASQQGQCATSIRRSVAGVAPPRLVESLNDVKVSKVAAGGQHTLCLTAGGRVFCWGSANEGQLGLGAGAMPYQSKPRLIGDLDFVAITASHTTATPEELSRVPKINHVAAGSAYSVAVSTSGDVYVWGSNDAGQLGVPKPGGNLPLLESYLNNGSHSLRQMHVQTFDSSHCLLLPHRLTNVEKLSVEQVACGPNHFWCVGSERKEGKKEKGSVGRTLYEVELDEQLQQVRKSWSSTSSPTPAVTNNLSNVTSSTINGSHMRHVPLHEDLTETEHLDEDVNGNIHTLSNSNHSITKVNSSKTVRRSAGSIPEAVIENVPLMDAEVGQGEDNITVSNHSTTSGNRWSIRNMMKRMSSSRSTGSNGSKQSRGRRFMRREPSL